MNAQDGNVAVQSNCSSSTSMCRLTFGQPDAATVAAKDEAHSLLAPAGMCCSGGCGC